jgi:ribosomal protein S7
MSLLKSGNKCIKSETIAKMLMSSIYNEGSFAKKKLEVHKLSISNRDFVRRFLK